MASVLWQSSSKLVCLQRGGGGVEVGFFFCSWVMLFFSFLQVVDIDHYSKAGVSRNKNATEVDIAPAWGKITKT